MTPQAYTKGGHKNLSRGTKEVREPRRDPEKSLKKIFTRGKRDIMLFVEDILESIERIESFSKGILEKEFMEDELRQSAIIRQIEIIGEAVKNIPEDFRKKYPKIEWKKIAGTRDIITHAYFGVDFEKIWEVVKKDLPQLKKEIKNILDKEK